MQLRHHKQGKLLIAILAGLLVWGFSSAADLALIPFDRAVVVRLLVGDAIGGLLAVIVCLAIQLRHEEVHYAVTMDRAAIVAELNHHIRNAMFPLCIAAQKTGDAEGQRIADEAMNRITLVLRDATADALSGKVNYHEPADEGTSRASAA